MKATVSPRRLSVFSDFYVQKYAATHSESGDDLPYDDRLSERLGPLGGGSESTGWNGLERRRAHDRRLQARRQQRGVSMLDTRTQSERRRVGRRQSDALYPSFVACKI
jgi:hypothetical protein